jgi:hypothetical protein
MIHLFDDDDRYTEAASIIDRQAYDALRPIFEFWVKEGYSRRDIYTVMNGAANELMLWSVLDVAPKLSPPRSGEPRTMESLEAEAADDSRADESMERT